MDRATYSLEGRNDVPGPSNWCSQKQGGARIADIIEDISLEPLESMLAPRSSLDDRNLTNLVSDPGFTHNMPQVSRRFRF